MTAVDTTSSTTTDHNRSISFVGTGRAPVEVASSKSLSSYSGAGGGDETQTTSLTSSSASEQPTVTEELGGEHEGQQERDGGATTTLLVSSSSFLRFEGMTPDHHGTATVVSTNSNKPIVGKAGGRGGLERQKSLALRKGPVNALLLPSKELSSTSLHPPTPSPFGTPKQQQQQERSTTTPKRRSTTISMIVQRRCIRTICLHPKFTLQFQLIVSFGVMSLCIISFVVILCVVLTIHAGQNVKQINQSSLKQLFGEIQKTSAQYIAEALTSQLIPIDIVNTVYEAALDRFAGYPNPTDEYVPFYNTIKKINQYPITGPPLPLDWDITTSSSSSRVTSSNYQEHVQDRWGTLFHNNTNVYANSFYFMRQTCNPQETNSTANTYWPNCTNANNNITTGGIDVPTSINEMIYRKSSDLGPLLKSLFEYHHDIKKIGIFFVNHGAGSFTLYPQVLPDSNVNYTSIGCTWMNLSNPYNSSQSIGTIEQINNCRTNGSVVPVRSYNVLERGWCRDQALQPHRIMVDGPYLDAWTANLVLITVGRSIYDRVTKQLIGCIGLDMVLSSVQKAVKISAIPTYMEVSVSRWDTIGTLVATSINTTTTSTNGNTNELLTIVDLNIGISQQKYKEVISMVNYTTIWDPNQVKKQYESYRIQADKYIVSTYPMPPIPDIYDPYYQPDFLVFLSVYRNAIDDKVQDVNLQVGHHENQAITIAIVLGFFGFIIIMIFIFLMANMITLPLSSMNKAAKQIMNSFGGTTSNNDNDNKIIEVISPSSRRSNKVFSYCLPKTELSNLVDEFQKMVHSFSGGSTMAKSMKRKQMDSLNQFAGQSVLQNLYGQRSNKDTDFLYTIKSTSSPNETRIISNHRRGFIHLGSNVVLTNNNESTLDEEEEDVDAISFTSNTNEFKNRFASPLFLWITLLIVTPLLLTSVCISAIVLYKIANEFRRSVQYASQYYLDVELSALAYYARARADQAAAITSAPMRDLHLLTRYTSWLFFGGLARPNVLVDMISRQEVSKTIPNVADFEKKHGGDDCDCAWNDNTGTCQTYQTDSRYLQKLQFCCQNQDTWPNGDRNYTSFPNVSYSPETTGWWSKVESIPGFDNSQSSSEYHTTYDRLQVASAMPLFPVLYNYDVRKEHALAFNIAFEADGLFVGYLGCQTARAAWWQSHFVSSRANGAFKLRPELCPLGKYGYDPRCREWYDTGKKLARETIGAVYVTPPYLFSTGDIFAQSAAAPFFDPITNVSLGQILVDFRADPIYISLENRTALSQDGFPILITTQPNNVGADTVIAPGFSRKETAQPIASLILRKDYNCTTDRCAKHMLQFEVILTAMRDGATGRSSFERTASDGSVEILHIAYAPVLATGYRPVNSSDYSRGVLPLQYLVYSLALVETEKGLLEAFSAVEEDIEWQIQLAIIILSISIFVAVVFVVYVSNLVTLSLTEPMIFLLKVIRRINQMDVDRDPPTMNRSYGSKELQLLSDAMEALYKVIRSVNSDFFAGNLEKAYFVLHDSLHLFRRLGNKKAIGVACNNLGNVMLAMYRRMQNSGEECFDELNRHSIIEKGISYYSEAIQLGEEAYELFYEQEGWTPSCLDFMQHLSNRYFNRAMFLLSVKKDHAKPQEIEALGLRDLEITRDMDGEIVSYGEEVGWGSVNRAEKLFEVALVRASGHISLMEIGYPDDWDVYELLNNTYSLLMKEMKVGSTKLFGDIRPIGRLQQLEAVLIRYYRYKGELLTAARIAVRYLIEDEYVFSDTHNEALQALLLYAKSIDASKDGDGVEMLQELEDYMNIRSVVMQETPHRQQDHEDLSAIMRSISVPSRVQSLKAQHSSTFRQEGPIGADVTMEVF